MTKITPKLKKIYDALRAIVDLAPWGGGLDADKELSAMHDILYKRFIVEAGRLGLSEYDALKACK